MKGWKVVPMLLVGLMVVTGSQVARADLIVWGPASQITGDSDVSTTGTLERAFNFGGAATTVNGVLFNPFDWIGNPTTTDNTTLTSLDKFFGSGPFFGSGSAPFAALSPSYQTLLGSGAFTATNKTSPTSSMDITLDGLTIGQTYQAQFFVNDPRIYGPPRTEVLSGSTPATLRFNTGAVGGLGQYVLGTFTADSTSQTFQVTGTDPTYLTNDSSAQVNAFQLRALAAPVPEPSTWAMMVLGLGGIALSGWRKKRKDAAV